MECASRTHAYLAWKGFPNATCQLPPRHNRGHARFPRASSLIRQMLARIDIQELLKRKVPPSRYPVGHVVASRVFTCQNAGTRRRTNMSCIGTGELDTLGGELIDMGCLVKTAPNVPRSVQPRSSTRKKITFGRSWARAATDETISNRREIPAIGFNVIEGFGVNY